MNHYERIGVIKLYKCRATYWRNLLRKAIDKGDDSEIIRLSLHLHKMEMDLNAILDEKFVFDNLVYSKQHVGRRVATAPDPLKKNEAYVAKPNFTPSFS